MMNEEKVSWRGRGYLQLVEDKRVKLWEGHRQDFTSWMCFKPEFSRRNNLLHICNANRLSYHLDLRSCMSGVQHALPRVWTSTDLTTIMQNSKLPKLVVEQP
jgi:hypothetical protein